MRKEDYYRRTMHTPDDPARAAQRATLREISRTLLPLHRALIEAARAEYDATVAPVTGPNHLLQLLGDDPFFAWLKPITALIVDIDEMVRTDYQAADAEAIAARVQRLSEPRPTKRSPSATYPSCSATWTWPSVTQPSGRPSASFFPDPNEAFPPRRYSLIAVK